MFRKFSSFRVVAILTLISFFAQLFSPFIGVVFADDTSYYVDASGGNDTNDGISPATAWQTLAHVNLQPFLPGDQILLKCGESWSEELVISSGVPITVSSYGTCTSSNKPVFTGSLSHHIRVLSGASDVTISGINFASGVTNHISLEDAGSNITISDSDFQGGSKGVILGSGSNISITHNTFQNISGTAIEALSGSTANIVENFFSATFSGGLIGIDLQDYSLGAFVTGNTFSGSENALRIKNSASHTITNNTFYNPYAHAIMVSEDGSVPVGTVENNSINNNTFLTWNPDESMIRVEDQSDALGTLVTFAGNTYLNVYKAVLPLVEILQNGAGTQAYSKDTINILDSSALTFTHFGYKNYTSTGVLNPRTRETYLLVNTGANSTNIACPSGALCGQYVNTNSGSITFPKNVSAYSSEIVFWNSAPNILHLPSCVMSPLGGGTIGNGQSVVLNWSVSGATNTTIRYPTSTGFTTVSVQHSATGEFYPPNPDGVANIYTLSGTNDIGSRVCTADIRTSNLAPVLYTFTGTGVEDALVITGQLVATDSPGDNLSYYIDSFPLTGGLIIVSGGLFEYTPPSNFCGDTTFNWNVSDGQVTGANPGTALIHVTCVNDALIVVDDVVSGTGGVTQSIDVLLNDINPDDGYTFETLTLSGVGGPSHGTISVVGSQFEYTPDMEYFGSDSFLYVVIDQSGAVSNTGTVSLTIAPGMNFAPIVSSGTANGNEDTQIVGTFSGSDLNGDTLSFSAISFPTNGTLGIAGDTYTYTPNMDFNGSDSFTFVANDGQIDSSGATIQLTLFPVEDLPLANNDTINVEMNTTSQLDILLNDTEPDGQSITLTGISTPTNGVASVVANRIQYTPTGGYLGSDSIDYVIEDTNGNLSNTGTVSISVTTTNQFPIADSGSWMTNEDTLLVASLSGSDPDATPVTFILDQNTTNGTLNLSSTGGFTYTPHLNFQGTDTFTFHVSDGVLSSPIQTVTIIISSLGDAPVATPDTQSGTEDTIVTLSPLSNDTDPDVGDTLSLLSFTVPGSGSLTQSGDTLIYTPIADFCGTDSFSYTIQDSTATPSNSAVVAVNLACVNDAPLAGVMNLSTIGNIITQSGNTLTGTLSGSDIDGPSLTFTLVLPGSPNGSVSVTSSGYFEYTPNIGFTGSDTFEYTISDGTFAATGTVNTTVLPNNYNAIPDSFSGSFTLSEDQIFSASLSGFDLEGVPLAFILDQNTTNGTLNLSSTGGFTYTPNLNFNGTDTFTFHVSDGVNNSLVATGTLTISPLNDVPVTVNDIAIGTEDTLLSISPVLNDTDVEGSLLSLFSFTTPGNGTLTQSGNTLTYYPVSNYCGADTFDYSVSDGTLTSNTGTVNITLACVNDVPIANNDFTSTTEDTPILIPVLLNDTELDIGDTLTITSLTQPATGGTVQVSGTGILYTPNANFCSLSPTMFSYRARDTAGTFSSTVTGTISSVTCVNDAPLAQNASYVFTSASGSVLTGSVYGSDFDGDSLNYSLQVTPFTGSISLTSTGYFEYTIPTNYSGLDTLSFLVNDGVFNSAPATLSICIIPPSGNPRPACAPALPAPQTTGPTAGPGGGGGGGGTFTPIFTSLVQNGETNELLAELLLSKKRMTSTGNTTPKMVHIAMNSTYTNILDSLTTIINPAKNQTVSATLQTQKIRSLGRSLLQLIVRDTTMTQKEKGYTISGVEEHLETFGQGDKVSSQNNRAIVYLMRFFKTKRVALLKSVSIASNFLR